MRVLDWPKLQKAGAFNPHYLFWRPTNDADERPIK